MNHKATSFSQWDTRLAGWLLGIASFMAIIAMYHHPSLTVQGTALQITEMNQKAFMSKVVHGTLISIVVLYCGCLSVFSSYRGLFKTTVVFGLVSYFFGSAAMVGAALINGFVVADLAHSFSNISAQQLSAFTTLQRLCWYANQSLANFGAYAWLFASLFWSFELLNNSGKARTIGWAIALLSCITLLGFGFDWFRLDVSGMTLIAIQQSTVYLIFAYLMITRESS